MINVDVVVPEMGEWLTEGTVSRWRRSVGEDVQLGDSLCDITTDKADIAIPAPATGRITAILVLEGQMIRVGGVIARMEAAASPASRDMPPVLANPHLASSGLLGTEMDSLDALKDATARMLAVRNGLEPIYHYYFPKSWTTVIARVVRLQPTPDTEKYLVEMQRLRDDAWVIVEDAERAFRRQQADEPDSVETAFGLLAYKQVYFDGSFVMLMNEWLKALSSSDPEAFTYFRGMKDMSDKAQKNRAELARFAMQQRQR